VPEAITLDLDMSAQPTPTTCGPTCLHAVYHHLGDPLSHATVVTETATLPGGGTLAVHLGRHALERGHRVTLYSFNLELLDPTWFEQPASLPAKLAEQADRRRHGKLKATSAAYARFLAAGGRLRMEELSHAMIRTHLERGTPLLAGVSATFLYRDMRERPDGTEDDLGGDPQGHFVVVAGYRGDQVLVVDPWAPGRSEARRYWVPMRRLVHAVLLGVLTYDGNLLAVERSS